jgi:hypothetical protein
MKKKKEETPQGSDLYTAILVDTYTTDEKDCFTKEWAVNDEQCSFCGMQSICMILTTRNVKKAGDMLAHKFGAWVDEIDFEKVPKQKLVDILKTDSFPIEQLREVFKQHSGCKDDVTVALQVNMFIRENNFKITSGYVHL